MRKSPHPFATTLAAFAMCWLTIVTSTVSSRAEDKPAPPAEQALPEPGPSEPGTTETAPHPSTAPKPGKPLSPLDLVMKNGIPAAAEKRAVLREDLYALLATAATAEEAAKIASQIERVWLTSGSDTVSVLLGRATRALKAKDSNLALNLLDAVVDLAPDNAEAWNRRAFVHYASKNYNAAVGDLRRALALDKNHYKALDGLASIFQQIGDDTKALAVYEQLRQIYPFWPGLDKAYETLKSKVQGRGI